MENLGDTSSLVSSAVSSAASSHASSHSSSQNALSSQEASSRSASSSSSVSTVGWDDSSSAESSSHASTSSSVNTSTSYSNGYRVSTYNLDKDILTPNVTFYANSGSTIKQVVYSSLTYRMYVNVESGSKAYPINNIYAIKITEGSELYTSSRIINTMVQLSKYEKLFYQDKTGNIYNNNRYVTAFEGQKVKLIGRDSNDNVFVQSATKKDTFFVLNDSKLAKTFALSDTGFEDVIYTDSGIYAVYSDYVIDITKDLKTKITYDKAYTFLNVIEDRIYFKDADGQYCSMTYN